MQQDNSKIKDEISFKMVRPIEELFSIDVNMVIRLFDEFGNLKDERLIHNVIPANGKTAIAAQLLAVPGIASPSHMAIGTGGTPTATLLQTEIARVAFDSKTAASNVVTMQGTFAAGVGTGLIVEEGLFNIATANTITMYASSSFAGINKLAADSLVITHSITLA